MSFKSNLKSQEIEETLQNVLRKDNTKEFVPTSDYHPATKKYVDDSNMVYVYDTTDKPALSNIQQLLKNNRLSLYGDDLSAGTGNSDTYLIPIQHYSYDNNADTWDNACKAFGWDINAGKLIEIDYIADENTGGDMNKQTSISKKTYNMPRFQVLTESEYSALGEAVNTDNVLYFVTPDAE